MSDSLLVIEDVHKSYAPALVALRGVSLAVVLECPTHLGLWRSW